MSSCLIRDDCLSFSFDTVSGDCKLHAIRGSGPRTSHNDSVIYRFRSGIGGSAGVWWGLVWPGLVWWGLIWSGLVTSFGLITVSFGRLV